MLFSLQKPVTTLLLMTSVMFWQTLIYSVYKLSPNYCFFKAIGGCPPGSSCSRSVCQHTQRTQLTEAAACQLSRFHHKEPMACKFAEYKRSGLSRVGCNVGGLPQPQNKAENNHHSLGSTSGYLRQPATRTNQQGCERLIKVSDWRLVLELGAGGGHFEHSQWQWNFGIWS